MAAAQHENVESTRILFRVPARSPKKRTMPEQRRPGWRYEPDERPKRKHGWDKNEAGFVEEDGVPVGKCPKNMSIAEAEALLNEGVPLGADGGDSAPRRIYAIHGGVLYRAVPTNPGVSYHGFPELPASFWRLPRRSRERVFEYARKRNMEKALRAWLEQ